MIFKFGGGKIRRSKGVSYLYGAPKPHKTRKSAPSQSSERISYKAEGRLEKKSLGELFSSSNVFPNLVQGRTGPYPIHLSGVVGMVGHYRVGRTVGVRQLEGELLSWLELVEVNSADLIVLAEEVVVGWVSESKREHTLLLQVGLVDTGERLHQYGVNTEPAWLHGRVLAAGSFTVVLLTNDDLADAIVAVSHTTFRNGHVVVRDVVEYSVGLLAVSVDGTNETVVRDVLQVTTELQPRAGHRDMVGRTLAFRLDEDAHVLDLLILNGQEGCQQLQAVAVWVNNHFDTGTVFGRSLEASVSYGEAVGWQFVALWFCEFHLFPFIVGQGIRQRIELHGAGEGHGSYQLGAGDETARLRVTVVTLGEVPVEGSEDGVGTRRIVGMTGPLADTRATGVGQYDAVDGLESIQDAIAFGREADLLGTGRYGELRLELKALGRSVFGDVGGAVEVFVAGVGTRADQADFQYGREFELVYSSGELGNREGTVWRVGAVDVRLQRIEVDFDNAVEVLLRVGVHFGVSGEVLGDLVGQLGHIGAVGGFQVTRHRLVVTEGRGRCSDLGTHITDGAFTGTANAVGAFAEVFHDGTSTALNGQDTGDLEDNVFRGCPTRKLTGQFHTDYFWLLEFPWHSGHYVYCVGTTNTDGDHTEATCIRRVAVGTDHHTAGEGVVFEDDLVNDTSTWLPETDVVLIGYGGEEVEDFAVDVVRNGEVLLCTNLGQDKVITVDGRRNGNLITASHHELKQCHLGGGILHRHAVGLEKYVVTTTLVLLQRILRVKVGIENFLRECQGAAQRFAGFGNFAGEVCVDLFDQIDVKCHVDIFFFLGGWVGRGRRCRGRLLKSKDSFTKTSVSFY
jgi:hypothetical protein